VFIDPLFRYVAPLYDPVPVLRLYYSARQNQRKKLVRFTVQKFGGKFDREARLVLQLSQMVT
jgi:hypothetical protein